VPWSRVTPVLLKCDPGRLCQRPYPGHKNGCPNYGKRPTCPPIAARWTPEYVAAHEWYVVWIEFGFGAHVMHMQDNHPDWSQRQCECCLYWQGTARKRLRDAVCEFKRENGIHLPDVRYVPEAHGCDVTATMATLGVALEWPPIVMTRHVAIVWQRPSQKGGA
jgi:predicted metal-binding protein